MAESQEKWSWDDERRVAVRRSLSEARFRPWLQASGGDVDYAFSLYLHNSRLAEAFLFPLHVAEVTLRNAIDAMLVRRFGSDWPNDGAFRSSVLTPRSLATLDKAIGRSGGAKNDVVATLTFDFWSNLFRVDYADLWRTEIRRVFPHLPRDGSRKTVQASVRSVNAFRNRVAHHEPILRLDVNAVHSEMGRLVALICPQTASWMRHHSMVPSMVRARPRREPPPLTPPRVGASATGRGSPSAPPA